MATIVAFPSKAESLLTRTCVLLHRAGAAVNLNDEFGLDAHSSYSISEYLEDQEREERRAVVARDRGMVVFNDGSVEHLAEMQFPLEAEVLNDLQ